MLAEKIKYKINLGWYLSKYGGLKNICIELNIPYAQASRIHLEKIKKDFYCVYQTYGHIDIEFYLKKGKYSKQAIRTAFGGVNNLMKELDIPLNMSRMESKDVVEADILCFCNKYKTTSSTMYRKYGNYCQSVIDRIWGSWENMTEDLELHYIGKTYGKEYMLESIKEIYNKYGFISKPLIDDECDFTYQSLRYYYKNKKEISSAIGVKNAFCDNRSSKAKVVEMILVNMYGRENVKTEYTWGWLVNPETNKNLKVDFYIIPTNTAIEYDGSQHDKFVKYFHKTEENFKKQQRRDALKDKLLKEHNIKLIRISHLDKITSSFIAQKLDWRSK